MKEQDHPDSDSPEESTEREPEIDLDRFDDTEVRNALDSGWDTILPGDIDEDGTDDPPPSEEDSE